jgi:uncharacterized protein (DUF58 family)
MIRRLLFRNFTLAHRIGAGFRRRVSPLGRLMLLMLVLAAVFGFDTHGAATYQWFTLLAALFGISLLWLVLSRRRFPVVAVARDLPRHATVGEPLRYTLIFTLAGGRPQRGLSVLDRLGGEATGWKEFQAAVDPEEARRNAFDRYVGYYKWRWLVHAKRGANLEEQAVPDLSPGRGIALTMELIPRRRGRLQFDGLSLLRPDPFGLLRSWREIPLPGSCRVLPKRYPASPLPAAGGRAYQRGGVALANSVGDSEEFMSLREYRPGDPVRNIDWRGSAKRDRWLVKEFQDEYFVRRALVLDTFCPPARAGDFEAAVAVAASLAMRGPERDALLDLMFVEREAHCFTAGRGLSHAAGLLEILAAVRPSPRADFSALAQNVLQRAAMLSSVTCVLLDLDEARRRFCAALAARGLSVAELLVREAPPEALPKAGIFLRHIRPSRIAEDLLWS